MELYLDSAELGDLRRWLATGVISGATTNPTLLRSLDSDRPYFDVLAEMADVLGPLPLSAEILRPDANGIVEEATALAAVASNIVVKVPLLLPSGEHTLAAVHELTERGVTVNVTACLSASQVLLALKAGASYASLLWGRSYDEGADPRRTLDLVREWRGKDAPGQIILASMRSVHDVYEALASAADIVTLPPGLLDKLTQHRLALATSQQFFDDAAALYDADSATRR